MPSLMVGLLRRSVFVFVLWSGCCASRVSVSTRKVRLSGGRAEKNLFLLGIPSGACVFRDLRGRR
jgi:hypothetical protein